MYWSVASDQVGVCFVSSVVVYVWSCLNGAIPPVVHAVFCTVVREKRELLVLSSKKAAEFTVLCVLAKSHVQCLLSVQYIHQNLVERPEIGVGIVTLVQSAGVSLCVSCVQ